MIYGRYIYTYYGYKPTYKWGGTTLYNNYYCMYGWITSTVGRLLSQYSVIADKPSTNWCRISHNPQFAGITLWNVNIAMENHDFNGLIIELNGPFPMAILVCWRVKNRRRLNIKNDNHCGWMVVKLIYHWMGMWKCMKKTTMWFWGTVR